LAISSASWRDFFENRDFLSQCFLDFQQVVSGGRFGIKECPYPAVFNIYLGLRWFREYDAGGGVLWTQSHLDRLFRAFFWRNTFSRRYDQGFLTRVSADILEFKEFLATFDGLENDQSWSGRADRFLYGLVHMSSDSAMLEQVKLAVTDGNVRGALRLGGLLLLHTRADLDVVDPTQDIAHMIGAHELHHVLPKRWCKDNLNEDNAEFLAVNKDANNWVDSPANLLPMASKSNKRWNTMSPRTAIETLALCEQPRGELLEKYFIDAQCIDFLIEGAEGVGKFLKHRANLIEKEIVRLMQV
jgi:hypothetical protein